MDWILRQARLADGAPPVDIGLAAGRIAAIAPNLPAAAAESWDLEGRVVLPGLVDAHTHLDKTYMATHNKSGTLMEAVEVWRRAKRTRSQAEVEAGARKALRTAVANGVTAMRSHVDTEEYGDLKTLATLLALREEMRDLISLQIVALGDPGGGPEQAETMVQALEMGADVVGAAPALMAEPRRTLDQAFVLAERFGRPLDLHIDETEDSQILLLDRLAERTIAYGMQGRVTAGHCCSLAFAEAAVAGRVMDKAAEAELHIITLPSCNLVLMGRGVQPAPRGITRVKDLLARGVNVSAASDNVHDPFNPFGGYDLLQIANLSAHAAHMSGEAELYTSLRMVTDHPARVLGLSGYGLAEGAAADLVVLDTTQVLEAVTSPPPRLATFKAGRLLVRTRIERRWGVERGSGGLGRWGDGGQRRRGAGENRRDGMEGLGWLD